MLRLERARSASALSWGARAVAFGPRAEPRASTPLAIELLELVPSTVQEHSQNDLGHTHTGTRFIAVQVLDVTERHGGAFGCACRSVMAREAMSAAS